MKPTKTDMETIGVLVIAMILAISFWVGASAIEARTYNKATGSNITIIEAMFCELRVIVSPSNHKEEE